MKYCFYSNPTENKARVSVVGEFDESSSELKIAVARCSENDQFIRVKGRAIATDRLNQGKLVATVAFPEAPASKTFIYLAKGIAQEIADDARLV